MQKKAEPQLTATRYLGKPCPRCSGCVRNKCRRCVSCDVKRINALTYKKRMTPGSVQRKKWLEGKRNQHERFAAAPGNIKRKASSYRSKLRQSLFEVYGSICRLCGHSDLEVLTLDHINGDGGWRKPGAKVTHQVYSEAIKTKDKKRFRILCFNCNHKAHLWKIRTGRVRYNPWR